MEEVGLASGCYSMPYRKIVPLLVGISVIAVACGGGSSDLRAGASGSGDHPESSGGGGFGEQRPEIEATLLPALDPGADSNPFEVDQIESTPGEDVDSALRNINNVNFPDPLISPEEVRSGGPPPDGIPPIDEPKFQTADSVDWLSNVEPVLSVEVNGEVRAYPIQVMTWHEIVNDTIGGVPVTISYCPLCNSALAYDRRVGDRIFDFGTSGNLFNSSLVMYDRQTESLWTHFDGRAVIGVLAGEQLTTLPVATTSWQSFRDAHPGSLVLSKDTGFRRDYGRNPYPGYDDVNTNPFLFNGAVDGRLAAKARVLVVRSADGPAVALTLESLFEQLVVPFTAQGREVVAVLQRGTATALGESGLADGYDQGATAVFAAEFEGEQLDLVSVSDGFLDNNSGVTFDIFGVATDGSGLRLEAIEHLDTFWFAIGAFEPDTEVIGL